MSQTRDIAIVIPVLADADALRRLLKTVRAWPTQPAEIVVANGADDAAVAAVCRDAGARAIPTRPNRGAQLDIAARQCRAATLWFLHADSMPAGTSLDTIETAIARGAVGGYFRFVFDGPRTWWKMTLQQLIRLRTRCGGVPYGDQGLFVGREHYLACEGFAHEPLFEEVRLVRRLRKRGRLEAVSDPIGVSTRRWDTDGWLYRSLSNRGMALAHAVGVPPRRLARRYRPNSPIGKVTRR